MSKNPFCYVELHTDGLKDALAFYKKVFDWKPTAPPGMPDYHMFRTETGVGGGLGAKQDPRAPNHWLPYVEVADLKKTIAKAGAAGATVMLPFMDLGPGMGAIGIFADPQGAAIGVWQKPAAPPPKKAAKKAPTKKVAKKAPTKKAPAKAVKKAAKRR